MFQQLLKKCCPLHLNWFQWSIKRSFS